MVTIELIKVCELDDITDGEGLRLEIDGFPALAVYRICNQAYATADLCTHGAASLAEGDLEVEEFEIICPFHSGSFDIRTGEPIGAPCTKAIKAYRTVVEDGNVFIEPEE
jgi:p-cumate 2,3-dioxygenase ferredoxin subunit